MTLPIDLYDLPTLEAALIAAEEPVLDSYKCPTCPRVVPASGLVDTDGLGEGMADWVCHTCASGPHRIAIAAQKIATATTPTWAVDDECANDIRARRTILLTACDWTQTLDAPLDETTKTAWATYRTALRDLPSTYANPTLVVWPTKP